MAQQLGPNSQAESGLASTPSDLHLLVLGWLNFHPGHTPEHVLADHMASAFIEPVTRH